MPSDIIVSYRFPSGIDGERQAKVIAIGQTAGSWGARFAHREAALQSHLGEVLGVQTLENGDSVARVGFPRANTENDIPTLLTMIFGKFSLAGPARVVDLELPADYGTPCKFGIPGLRELTGVAGRPLFMGIFKPALGLSAADHAELLAEVAGAGLDLIKDDEILPDLPGAPTLERARLCREVIDAAGRPLLYAVNLTGPVNLLNQRARALIDAGANALLLNVLSYGYGALQALAADAEIKVPIFAHPALAGALCGSERHGMDYSVVLGSLMRFAGADAVLYPAHYGSLPFDRADEFAIVDKLRENLPARHAVMPVPSAGIHPGITGRAWRDYGDDVVLNAGSAIFDHPQGPEAGTRAFFEAWERVRAGQTLRAEEIDPGALKTALETWGDES